MKPTKTVRFMIEALIDTGSLSPSQETYFTAVLNRIDKGLPVTEQEMNRVRELYEEKL